MAAIGAFRPGFSWDLKTIIYNLSSESAIDQGFLNQMNE